MVQHLFIQRLKKKKFIEILPLWLLLLLLLVQLILGQVSAGIEPYSSNYYKAGLAKGNFIRKNKYLQELLKSKEEDTEEKCGEKLC